MDIPRTLTAALIIALSISFASQLSAQKPPEQVIIINEAVSQLIPNAHPENTSPLYAYGGYGYFGWKMISTGDYMSIFTGGESEGLGYKHNADPFIVKRYGVKSNLWIFSLGLDYFSDKFSLPTEYDRNEDLEKNEDRRARQLKLLSGLHFGKTTLHANVIFREFNSTITSRGQRDYNGIVRGPLIYYPKTGDAIHLLPGEEFSWYTQYTQYEVKFETIYTWGAQDFGLKIMKFEAPSELSISTDHYSSAGFANGYVLMYTKNTMYSLFYGVRSLSRLGGNFYLSTYTPMDLGFGGNKATCDYFEAGSLNPMEYNRLFVSSAGTIALQYLRPHVKLEAGLDYGLYVSMVTLDDTKLKKDITFYDDFSDKMVTAKAGDMVDLNLTRIEVFWGLYLSACIYL